VQKRLKRSRYRLAVREPGHHVLDGSKSSIERVTFDGESGTLSIMDSSSLGARLQTTTGPNRYHAAGDECISRHEG